MKIKFTANQAKTCKEHQAIIAGLANDSGEYVMFQRSINKSNDDGPYFEFNDQINSGYKIVKSCKISRNRIEINLIQPFDSLSIDLQISNTEYLEFINSLRFIYFDDPGKFKVIA